MPQEPPFVPPTRKPVSTYPTPDHSVAFYTELVNRDDPAYYRNAPVQRGALYSTMVGAKQSVIDQYPTLFFLKERKFQLNDQLVLWDWATDEQAHDTYNADVTYVANAITYPAITRTYTIRREIYEAAPTLPIGSPLPGIIAVTITSPGQNYTKATGVIDGTGVAIQFNVSDNGGLIAGIITNTGAELIPNGTDITIIGDGQDGSATAVTQPLGCVLTAQKKEELPPDDPTGHELVKTTLVYETLPGPWIYTTRMDKDGAIITSKTRRQITDFIVDKDVIENGQWIQTFHKGADDFVSEETVESRMVPGNPIISTKIDEDGNILTSIKQLVATTDLVSSETLVSGIWTKQYGEEVDGSSLIKVHQASYKVTWQMTDAREIPGNPIPSTDLDKDGNEIDIVKTLKATTDIVTDETIVGGIWIRTDSEPVSDLVSREVVRARVVPGDPVPSANVEADHEVAIIASTFKEASTIVPAATELAGVITTTDQKEVSELVSEEIITVKPWLDTARYSVAVSNVIPELFRAFIPVRTESHILAGTAGPPVLGFGEFERSERQVTKLLFERVATVLDSVAIPFTFCGFRETNQYKQIVTVCYTLELDSVVPPVPTALCDVEVIQLGNGMQVVITRCVPNIYAAQLYEETKPDVTPEIFKATIPLDTASEIVAGSPTPPTLGLGEYRASEREVTEFTKETSLTSRDLTALPQTVTSFETNRDKEVVTVNTTLEVDPTAPPTPDATTDVSYNPLGDGTAVAVTRNIPEVFGGQTYEKEIPDVVPVEFRVAIPTETQEVSSAGTAADPSLGAGDLTKRETQTDKFVKRVLHRFRSLVGLPITLISYATSGVKQLITVTRTLKVAGAPTPPSATTTVETQNLGDGTVVETVQSVPDVFGEDSFKRTRPDVTPPEFRALLQTTTDATTTAGTAADPTLGIGQLEKTSEQQTEFTVRNSTTQRDLTAIPQTITDIDTDRDKQVETIAKTLELSGTATATPNATTNVSVTQLGDGTEVQQVRSVPQVFGGQVYEEDIPDVVPIEFRVAIPTSTTEVSQAGTAVDPSLGAGDLTKRETQTDTFVKRVYHKFRSLVGLPVTLISYATSNVKQLVTISRTLKVAAAPTPPTATTTVEQQNLGDGTVIETVNQVPDVFSEASFRKTRPDVTPPEFRALLLTDTQSTVTAGTASDPTLGVGQLEKTSEQTTEFTVKNSTTARDLTTIPQTITDTATDRDKQVETINKTLELSGTSTATPNATTTVSVTQLGDGTEVENVTSVPTVFGGQVFEEEIPDVVPVEFRVAIPTSTTEVSQAGTAADPSLGAGDLTKRETQTDTFVKRVFHRFRSLVGLPVSLVSYATSSAKQLVTVTRTLKLAAAPTSPTATTTVEQQNLGDGTVIETVNSVPDVFAEDTFRRSRPDVTPPEFRALLQTTTQATTAAGTAADPTLGIGQLEKTSEQQTEFTKRDSTTARDLTSIPQTITDVATDRDKQVETINKTLELSGTSTATPNATTTVSVTQLGDGTEVENVTSIPTVFGGQVFEEEIPDVVPIEFRVAIPTSTTEVTQAGTAANPTLAAGDLTKRETQKDKFVKTVFHRFRSLLGLPVSLVSYATSGVKQLVTVTRTLKNAAAPTAPTATTTVEQQNLGDGTVIETVNSVPDVFGKNQFGIRIPDVVPVEFRVAVPTTTTSVDAAGTAVAPTLGAGDLEKTETQVDEFVKRSETQHRQALSYPISLPSSKLTPEGQIETITQVLDVGLQVATGSATTIESEVRNLGDGTSLKTQGTVPDVFDKGVYKKEIPDLVPQEFRPFVPTTTTTVSSAGTASTNPVLGTGDLVKQEAQETEFVKRVSTESRGSIVLPITHQNTEITSRFGGGVVNKSITLENTGAGTIDQGLTVIDSSITDLGNNTEIKRTDQLSVASWPILQGTHVDEKYGIAIGIQRQVVAAGTTGGGSGNVITEVRPIDKWKSIQITSTLDTGSLPSPVQWFSSMTHSFPPVLTDAVVDWASAFCGCSTSFAAILVANLDQYSGIVKTRITEQFYNGPPPDNVTLYQFHPKQHNFGYAWSSFCGDSDGNCTTKSGAPEFHIPLCLHGDLFLSIGISATWSFPATTPVTLPSGSYIMFDAHVERWRFGVFRRVLTEVLVP